MRIRNRIQIVGSLTPPVGKRGDANPLANLVWNVRIELGQHLSPTPMRLTELVPAGAVSSPPTDVSVEQVSPLPTDAPVEQVSTLPAEESTHKGASARTGGPTLAASSVSYGPPRFAGPSHTGGFAGTAFSLQPDGTLLWEAEHLLSLAFAKT